MFARALAPAPALLASVLLRSRDAFIVIVGRLRMLEALARKLLLAEASALGLFEAAAPSVVKPAPRRARAPTPVCAIDPDKPETWATHFSLRLPREPRARRRRRALLNRNFWTTPSPAHPSALNIALRAEALRRVLNDPAPYARRLARLLTHARVRAPRIVTRCALFTPRRYVADPQDPLISFDIVANVLATTAGFGDSS